MYRFFAVISLALVVLLSDQMVLKVWAKCWQKNTEREAHRDIYLCKNQYFEPGKKLADPEDCACYYDCNYKQQPCYTCCPDGQVFKPNMGCVLREAYSCQNQPPKFRCQLIGLFKHSNCRKYWSCDHKLNAVEEACQSDYHWDDQEKVCRKDSQVLRNSCE